MGKPLILFISWRRLKIIISSIIILLMAIIVYEEFVPRAWQTFYPLWSQVIVIDPGHGGIDGGANAPDFLEKEINLAIALKLRDELEKQGARVIMTREKDQALQDSPRRYSSRHRQDLASRVEIIEQYQPDLFISIHVNANPRRPQTSGPMVFYNRRIPAAARLAQTVQKKLNELAVQEGNQPHRAQPGEYFLLRQCNYPGLIIETGFITNKREREMLKGAEYQDKLARQIAAGIFSFYVEQDIVLPEPTEADRVQLNQGEGASLYFPTVDGDELKAIGVAVTAQFQGEKRQQLVSLLVRDLLAGPDSPELQPVFPSTARLLGVELIDGFAVVNLAAGSLPSGTDYQEQLALRALTETVCSVDGVYGLKVLLEGQEQPLTGVLTPARPKIKIAIVIDDLAGSNRGLDQLLALQRPLTLAVMPKLELTRPTAEKVHRLGYQVFLHLPMEPERGKRNWLGPGAITADMTPEQVRAMVLEDLADVPYASGMNNHMGSKITRRRDLMYEVLKIAREKHLIYLDSRTAEDTVVPALGRELNWPVLERSIFLDDINSVPGIKKQIRELARLARQKGEAIAIGHVGITGPNLARALKEMIPWLEEQGIELVFVGDLWAERSRS